MPRYLEIAASYKRNLNWDAVRDVPVPGGLVYDMRKLPMDGVSDNTYNGVYNEHFIEHLEKDEGIRFFKEMLRIMKPGGILRTVWPPMEFVHWLQSDEDLTNNPFVQHYYNFYVVKHKFAPPGHEDKPIQLQCAEGFLWQNGEHKYLWYKQEMIDELKKIGYNNVKEFSYQKSQVPDFRGIEVQNAGRSYQVNNNLCASAVIEAEKPW